MNEMLFIRHAETDMAGTFCGHSDPPINGAGRAQIAKLLDALRGEDISVVYTSDLQRAVATGQAIAEFFGVPCVSRRGLREIDFGTWDGLTWQQIEAVDPAYAQRWLDEFPNLPAPQGEGVEEFEARVQAEVDYLQRQCDTGSIAIVTHAGVMRCVLRTVCALDEKMAWELTSGYTCFFRCDRAGHSLEGALR